MKNLVNKSGSVDFGWIKEPIEQINYMDFDLRSVMDAPLSKLRKRFRFNQFHFVGLMSPEVICGIAVVDLKMVSNTFLYVYDFKTGKMLEKSVLQPLGIGTSIGTQPDDNVSKFSQGNCKVQLTTRPDKVTQVDVVIGKEISIQAEISAEQKFDPLRICSQAGYDGWVFTQKSAGLKASGSIKWGDLNVQLDPETAYGSADWSCGFMRRETFWNWACFAGQDEKGRMLGLNLAAGVNETGVTENCLWLDNKLQKLDMAVFRFDRNNLENEWRVTTSCGRVDLKFKPEGRRQEKIDVLLLASNFKQMFGKFYGVVKCGREKVVVDGVPGFVEDHFARW